jgi:Protein of unknown function (DUF4240)
MDEQEFWRVIAYAKNESEGEVERTAGVITELLVEQSLETILDFDRLLYDFIAQAYTPNLWAAAYVINYGSLDDGFDHFVAWLIAKGEDVYEAALADPESLAEVLGGDEAAECESMLYVAQYAYERRVGREMPIRHRQPPPRDVTILDESALSATFPRLWSRFSM